ncbi:hypothetical protein CspHIS471_0100640 [Cutaneotrichosporon sp. HIS471]|nr:hypothetical protein CspHIS471_0100640 [Cutaneotrichosporon sp. HIS471]
MAFYMPNHNLPHHAFPVPPKRQQDPDVVCTYQMAIHKANKCGLLKCPGSHGYHLITLRQKIKDKGRTVNCRRCPIMVTDLPPGAPRVLVHTCLGHSGFGAAFRILYAEYRVNGPAEARRVMKVCPNEKTTRGSWAADVYAL